MSVWCAGVHGADAPYLRRSCRIVVLGAGADSMHERNFLHQHVIPSLRSAYREKGVDLDVVDLFTGVGDGTPAPDDLLFETLVLNEISLAQSWSTMGIQAVVFVGDFLGARYVPRMMDSSVFDAVLQVPNLNPDDVELLQRWYRPDGNDKRSIVRLKKPSMEFDTEASIEMDRLRAVQKWVALESQLLSILEAACEKDGTVHSACMPHSILSKGWSGICNWRIPFTAVRRVLRNIEDTDPLATSYLNVDRAGRFVEGAVHMHDKLVESISESSQSHSHTVIWDNGGLTMEVHGSYFRDMADDVRLAVTGSIDTVLLQQAPKPMSRSVASCLASSADALSCSDRSLQEIELTNIIRTYVHENEELSRPGTAASRPHSSRSVRTAHSTPGPRSPTPNELHSTASTPTPSETGSFSTFGNASGHPLGASVASAKVPETPLIIKTRGGLGACCSIAAVCNELHQSASAQSDTIVNNITVFTSVRYSSSLPTPQALLRRIVKHLRSAMEDPNTNLRGEDPADASSVPFFALIQTFHELLARASHSQRIVIAVDSLDCLIGPDPSWMSIWLPKSLPPFVRIIVSVNAAAPSQVLEPLLEGLPAKRVIDARTPTVDGALSILDAFLAREGRQLTLTQRSAVLDAMTENQFPSFARLMASVAGGWHSTSDPPRLPRTIAGILDLWADRLSSLPDRFNAEMFGLIACTPGGLSEVELCDIVSTNDRVLADLFKSHSPAIRRCPRLHVVRFLHLAADILHVSQSHGLRVYSITHPSITQAIINRFHADAGIAPLCTRVGSYFTGELHEKFPDRLLTEQPWYWQPPAEDKSYNYRKLELIPHLLAKASAIDALQNLLCAPSSLYCQMCIEAGMVNDLRDVFTVTLLELDQSNASGAVKTAYLTRFKSKIHELSQYFSGIQSFGDDSSDGVSLKQRLIEWELECLLEECNDFENQLLAYSRQPSQARLQPIPERLNIPEMRRLRQQQMRGMTARPLQSLPYSSTDTLSSFLDVAFMRSLSDSTWRQCLRQWTAEWVGRLKYRQLKTQILGSMESAVSRDSVVKLRTIHEQLDSLGAELDLATCSLEAMRDDSFDAGEDADAAAMAMLRHIAWNCSTTSSCHCIHQSLKRIFVTASKSVAKAVVAILNPWTSEEESVPIQRLCATQAFFDDVQLSQSQLELRLPFKQSQSFCITFNLQAAPFTNEEVDAALETAKLAVNLSQSVNKDDGFELSNATEILLQNIIPKLTLQTKKFSLSSGSRSSSIDDSVHGVPLHVFDITRLMQLCSIRPTISRGETQRQRVCSNVRVEPEVEAVFELIGHDDLKSLISSLAKQTSIYSATIQKEKLEAEQRRMLSGSRSSSLPAKANAAEDPSGPASSHKVMSLLSIKLISCRLATRRLAGLLSAISVLRMRALSMAVLAQSTDRSESVEIAKSYLSQNWSFRGDGEGLGIIDALHDGQVSVTADGMERLTELKKEVAQLSTLAFLHPGSNVSPLKEEVVASILETEVLYHEAKLCLLMQYTHILQGCEQKDDVAAIAQRIVDVCSQRPQWNEATPLSLNSMALESCALEKQAGCLSFLRSAFDATEFSWLSEALSNSGVSPSIHPRDWAAQAAGLPACFHEFSQPRLELISLSTPWQQLEGSCPRACSSVLVQISGTVESVISKFEGHYLASNPAVCSAISLEVWSQALAIAEAQSAQLLNNWTSSLLSSDGRLPNGTLPSASSSALFRYETPEQVRPAIEELSVIERAARTTSKSMPGRGKLVKSCGRLVELLAKRFALVVMCLTTDSAHKALASLKEELHLTTLVEGDTGFARGPTGKVKGRVPEVQLGCFPVELAAYKLPLCAKLPDVNVESWDGVFQAAASEVHLRSLAACLAVQVAEFHLQESILLHTQLSVDAVMRKRVGKIGLKSGAVGKSSDRPSSSINLPSNWCPQLEGLSDPELSDVAGKMFFAPQLRGVVMSTLAPPSGLGTPLACCEALHMYSKNLVSEMSIVIDIVNCCFASVDVTMTVASMPPKSTTLSIPVAARKSSSASMRSISPTPAGAQGGPAGDGANLDTFGDEDSLGNVFVVPCINTILEPACSEASTLNHLHVCMRAIINFLRLLQLRCLFTSDAGATEALLNNLHQLSSELETLHYAKESDSQVPKLLTSRLASMETLIVLVLEQARDSFIVQGKDLLADQCTAVLSSLSPRSTAACSLWSGPVWNNTGPFGWQSCSLPDPFASVSEVIKKIHPQDRGTIESEARRLEAIVSSALRSSNLYANKQPLETSESAFRIMSDLAELATVRRGVQDIIMGGSGFRSTKEGIERANASVDSFILRLLPAGSRIDTLSASEQTIILRSQSQILFLREYITQTREKHSILRDTALKSRLQQSINGDSQSDVQTSLDQDLTEAEVAWRSLLTSLAGEDQSSDSVQLDSQELVGRVQNVASGLLSQIHSAEPPSNRLKTYRLASKIRANARNASGQRLLIATEKGDFGRRVSTAVLDRCGSVVYKASSLSRTLEKQGSAIDRRRNAAAKSVEIEFQELVEQLKGETTQRGDNLHSDCMSALVNFSKVMVSGLRESAHIATIVTSKDERKRLRTKAVQANDPEYVTGNKNESGRLVTDNQTLSAQLSMLRAFNAMKRSVLVAARMREVEIRQREKDDINKNRFGVGHSVASVPQELELSMSQLDLIELQCRRLRADLNSVTEEKEALLSWKMATQRRLEQLSSKASNFERNHDMTLDVDALQARLSAMEVPIQPVNTGSPGVGSKKGQFAHASKQLASQITESQTSKMLLFRTIDCYRGLSRHSATSQWKVCTQELESVGSALESTNHSLSAAIKSQSRPSTSSGPVQKGQTIGSPMAFGLKGKTPAKQNDSPLLPRISSPPSTHNSGLVKNW